MPRTVAQDNDDSQQMLALSIAVQQLAFSSKPQVLCAAAQACKGLQQAVRQRTICNTAVVLHPDAPHQQLHSFASWLANHAHLVSSITANRTEQLDAALNVRVPADVEVMYQYWGHTMFAQRLLVKALQPAVTPAATAAAAAAAGSPAGDPEQAAPQQQQQLLRMTRFSSNYANPPVLKALPAHSLTCLQLDASGLLETECPEVPQLLAGLSNLQELQLEDAGRSELPGSCFAAIAQLSKLTRLHVEASRWWMCIIR
uniref:Uncharacterized protein n=1 Tax=Tetradesmus obliquus TaxID=3088 RepID=A0A383VXR4_TETOB|eukprot:jgi/Sobl393_1/6018/SZX69612.1